MNREEWLNAAYAKLRETLLPEAPEDILVSVGWPGGRGKKDSVIGQHWPTAEGKRNHIFISPKVDDPLHILLHEMIHASCEPGTQHGGEFIVLCKRVGLVKPWTATTPGEELADTLRSLTEELGDYPHEVLEPLPAIKKQSTRQLKAVCKECGYTVRVTRKWLNIGVPVCPCGTEMEEA